MQLPSKILFLPGASGNTEFWRPLSHLLTYPASHKHIGWPGFGGVPPDDTIRSMADLIPLVLKEIDQPCALVAQSMGGIIAIQAALQRPDLVTHLVLTVTSGGVDMSAYNAEDWRPAFFKANPQLPRWFGEYTQDISDSIHSVNVPVLLLWGDADPISPVAVGKRLNELLPQSQLHVFPGADHDLGYTLAASIAPLIDQHIRNTF